MGSLGLGCETIFQAQFVSRVLAPGQPRKCEGNSPGSSVGSRDHPEMDAEGLVGTLTTAIGRGPGGGRSEHCSTEACEEVGKPKGDRAGQRRELLHSP